MTTRGNPFTNSTTSGMMKFLMQPGVSMRNWLTARNSFRRQSLQSINVTSG